jgi:hypothetical protein
MTTEKIAKMMEDEGCTGKRVTKESIDERIEAVEYTKVTICGQLFMYCGIKLRGGFVVVGLPAACIDPSNWRDNIGQTISYDNSFAEIWRLEAYRMLTTEVY